MYDLSLYLESKIKHELYFDGFLIDNHGEINVPTLGKVSVLNLTIVEIKEKIEQELLEKYFKC